MRVGLVGFALSALAALWILSQLAWNPTVFVGVGEAAQSIREYAEVRLDDVFLRSGDGHDGKFFFVQGNDPWVLEPSENAMILDRPLYRSQRMLYPLIASGFGTLGSEQIVWGLLIVNIIGLGLGSWAVASIATQMGMSPWWGLAFLLNIGFVSEFNISGAGILAGAAAFGAVAATMRFRFGWGVALLTVAALTREAMLLTAAGTAWWLWHFQGKRREGVIALTIPLSLVAIWAVYLRMRLGMASGVSQVREIGLPFVGFVQAQESWRSDPIDPLVGLAIMILLALYTRRVLSSDHLVGWAFLGFVALGVLFTAPVWDSYFDITRAIAPIITSFVLLMFAPTMETQRTRVRP